MDFDRLCNQRLMMYETEKRQDLFKGINLAVLAANAGEVLKFENEESFQRAGAEDYTTI